jgi:ABC-2 type transport system ATP-binding protein
VPGLRILELEPGAESVRLTATIDAAIDPVIKALAALRVVDLDIETPDLEESVLRLYGDADGSIGEEVRDA